MKLKILLLNLGYCTGLNGSLQHYFLRFYRYLYTPRNIQNGILQKLRNIIAREQPDLCCLLEITKPQMKTLLNKQYRYPMLENKYGKKSMLYYLPVFRKKCNGFLARKGVPFKRYFFRHGTKKLVYAISLPNNLTVVMAHFSLIRSTREKQFKEVKQLITGKKKAIVCGDFNIFDGLEEVAPLLEQTNMRIMQTDVTFPAYKPKRALDLFICSKNLKTSCTVLNDQLSDHLPVVLEVEL